MESMSDKVVGPLLIYRKPLGSCVASVLNPRDSYYIENEKLLKGFKNYDVVVCKWRHCYGGNNLKVCYEINFANINHAEYSSRLLKTEIILIKNQLEIVTNWIKKLEG